MLYGGDRFLAADLELIRLSATGMDNGSTDAEYLIRAQRVVAELNPCHEDNYYLANGLLAWGGGRLQRVMKFCVEQLIVDFGMDCQVFFMRSTFHFLSETLMQPLML